MAKAPRPKEGCFASLCIVLSVGLLAGLAGLVAGVV
jgi:hypothetical protein